MIKKWVMAACLMLIIGLFIPGGSAQAGGWVTMTLTELPTEVVVERPFTIEYLLLQHGQTPFAGSDVVTQVTAVHVESGEQISVPAQAGAAAGYYEATITLPQSGQWEWQVQLYTTVYKMPPLMVNEAIGFANIVGGETAVAAQTISWQLIVGWMAALGAGFALLLWRQQKSRSRLAGVVLLGVVSLVGFGLYWQMPQVVQAEENVARLPAIEPEQLGEALFVAKGCVQCHTNDKVTMAENMYPIGPDLSLSKRDPGYLKHWLADPSDLKANTQMPNLRLSETEINSLVAFLTQD